MKLTITENGKTILRGLGVDPDDVKPDLPIESSLETLGYVPICDGLIGVDGNGDVFLVPAGPPSLIP